MSGYNYREKIIEDSNIGSYQEKFLDYATNWEDDTDSETKRVKIINCTRDDKDENLEFEDKINAYIEENKNNIKIFDIKYQKNSVMIIYEEKKKDN